MEEASLAFADPRGFICVKPTGTFTHELALECGRQARALPEFKQGWPALIDLSGTTTVDIASEDLVKIGERAQQDPNRVALLAPDAPAYGIARIYEIVSDISEGRVNVFLNEKDALGWLGIHD